MTGEFENEGPRENPLKDMRELFSEKALKRMGESKAAELERVLTEEGLRELAHTRTTYILDYMSRPDLNYRKDDWYNFKRLLLPTIEDQDVVDPTTLWYAIDDPEDPRRIQIALDEIGRTVGVDINSEAKVLQERAINSQMETDSSRFPTHNPLFDVMILYDKSQGLNYRFVKNADNATS